MDRRRRASTRLYHFTTRANAEKITRDGWIRPGHSYVSLVVAMYNHCTPPSDPDVLAEFEAARDRDPKVVWLSKSPDPVHSGLNSLAEVRFDLHVHKAVPWTQWLLLEHLDHPDFDIEWVADMCDGSDTSMWFISSQAIELQHSLCGMVMLGEPRESSRQGPRLPASPLGFHAA